MAIPPFRVKAVYEYSSPHNDDLSFSNGQIITVTDEEDSDWYYGEYLDPENTKHKGLFPRNFVERYEPATPPRPSRSIRSKRDTEFTSSKQELVTSELIEDRVLPEESLRSYESTTDTLGDIKSAKAVRVGLDNVGVELEEGRTRIANSKPSLPTSKSTPGNIAKPEPLQMAENPNTGSFRDRIAAFNKPTAPPVAPVKPTELGRSGNFGFVKRAFNAPPPSKNTYVSTKREPLPQRLDRREEDLDVAAQSGNDIEAMNQVATQVATPYTEDNVDEPKPTRLKDRIALLQKQQIEQAPRHTESSQKREKPKRPPKKRMESFQGGGAATNPLDGDEENAIDVGAIDGADTAEQHFNHVSPSGSLVRDTSLTRSSRIKEVISIQKPAVDARETLSDANDADQSGAGDTEGEEASTGKDDSDDKSRSQAVSLSRRDLKAPTQEVDVGDADDLTDENEDEGEDVDTEIKRRMEIRERMAKMSGGMGMAGMFGVPGIPAASMLGRQKSNTSSDKRASGSPDAENLVLESFRTPPIPIIPMPGMQRVQSPEPENSHLEIEKQTINPQGIDLGHDLGYKLDVEEPLLGKVLPLKTSEDIKAPPSVDQDRPVPKIPLPSRSGPPFSHGKVPPLSLDNSQPIWQPLPNVPMSPSAGSEPDDEMSLNTNHLSFKTEALVQPPSDTLPPPVPARSRMPQPPSPQYDERSRNPLQDTTPPAVTSKNIANWSRVPLIPGSSPAAPSSLQSRAPPQPPPGEIPLSRRSTGDSRGYLFVPAHQTPESEGEVTEYDGDYDTDIAPRTTHKATLSRTNTKGSVVNDPMVNDEELLHHPGLPSLGPPPIPGVNAPRAGPPPLPNQTPRISRQSVDMPRTAPPAPPPAPKERRLGFNDELYDTYRYSSVRQDMPAIADSVWKEEPNTPRYEENYDDINSTSPLSQHMHSPPTQANPYVASPAVHLAGRSLPRQSMEIPRTLTGTRRSMDAPRPSLEQGSIASDIDLGQGSQWWIQRNMPPPVLQNRRDIKVEIEESVNALQSDGKATKRVFVLFMDYSQTIITAQFDPKDPRQVELQQQHEVSPSRLRQDQLEDAHAVFGARIAEHVNTKQNSTVSDGSPHSLVMALLDTHPDALPPVGVRAYGALVYANLANASVQQHDEIRSGDIVSFRNTKFQGHRGPMHQKYTMEVGRPDHVGIVVDWDGTKKKVRAWEQGRESKKVKMESFKLGDLRSGEVKVWRVMPRSWVGWAGHN